MEILQDGEWESEERGRWGVHVGGGRKGERQTDKEGGREGEGLN